MLGLCEEGVVLGMPRGKYSRSLDNKKYALQALELLLKDPRLAQDEQALWARVMAGRQNSMNSQMDVVIALWNANMLAKGS